MLRPLSAISFGIPIRLRNDASEPEIYEFPARRTCGATIASRRERPLQYLSASLPRSNMEVGAPIRQEQLAQGQKQPVPSHFPAAGPEPVELSAGRQRPAR